MFCGFKTSVGCCNETHKQVCIAKYSSTKGILALEDHNAPGRLLYSGIKSLANGWLHGKNTHTKNEFQTCTQMVTNHSGSLLILESATRLRSGDELADVSKLASKQVSVANYFNYEEER